jgi:hypothetical protein
VQSEYLGGLGSVDAAVSVRERLAFWAKLPERLARLSNRVGPDEHGKIYDALHARIPMVTPEEQRTIQEENAKDDERFWAMMHDLNAASAEEHKGLIASAATKKAELEAAAVAAVERRDVARERLAKLARGESVAGGLGKKPDLAAVFEGGWPHGGGFQAMRAVRVLDRGRIRDGAEAGGAGSARGTGRWSERRAGFCGNASRAPRMPDKITPPTASVVRDGRRRRSRRCAPGARSTASGMRRRRP